MLRRLAGSPWGLVINRLLYRGGRWVAAGEHALGLADQIAGLVPAPAPGTVVAVYGTPGFLRPLFPPGNTGPYLYINGLQGVMKLRHGWNGVAVLQVRASSPPQREPDVILEIEDGIVRLRETPP